MFTHPIKGSPDRAVEFLFGVIEIGAAGAIASQDCNGFSVVKEVADGTYTVTFDRAAQRLLWPGATLEIATPADTQINCNEGAASATSVQFEVVSAGALANPASGDRIHFMFALSRAGLPRTGA